MKPHVPDDQLDAEGAAVAGTTIAMSAQSDARISILDVDGQRLGSRPFSVADMSFDFHCCESADRRGADCIWKLVIDGRTERHQ